MAGIMDTINAILRRSGIDPNAGARPYTPPPEDFTGSQQQPPTSTTELPGAAPQATVPPPEAPVEPAPAGPKYDPTLPYRSDTQDDLERFENTRKQFENDLQELFRIRGEAGRARAAATTTSARQRATDEYDAADTAVRQMQAAISTQDTRIAAEKNRRRDEKKAEDAKEPKPKNGDTRIGRDTYTLPNGQTVRGVFTEVYNNGTWSFVPGSSKREEGWAGQPQGPGEAPSVITDGRGTYWTLNPRTGQATPISGPQAAAKTITDPDGNVFLQNPDGRPGQKLFDAAAKTVTDNGRIIGYDNRGQKLFEVDVKTPEGRELADRLERATVEAAERQADPKFASASAQYAQEAQRRQALARTELSRLLKLQEEGQISPEEAQKQFDRWMKVVVEGPLAGYQRAAQEEEEAKRQADLVRTNAEQTRVEEYNLRRGQLAAAAGEAGRSEAIELGQATRAPEYIADLGNFAQSLGQGKTDFQFSPESFKVENFRRAVPNVQELADAAVERLLSRIGGPATAREVNTPRAGLPTGPDLAGMMNSSRYQGPVAQAAPGALPVPGQEAVDQNNGMARTIFNNGTWQDWKIPTTPGAVPAPAAPAPPALPGQLPGETEEERRARFYAIR